MARVIYTGAVSDFVGSIAGTTFQKNRSGNIARSKPYPRSVVSGTSSIPRSIFFSMIGQWNSLSLADQLDWNTFANTHDHSTYYGETKTISGMNFFISINSYRFLNSQALLTSPPAWALPAAVPAFSIVFSDVELSIEFDPDFDHENEYLYIFASPVIKSQSLSNRRLLRLIKIVEPDTSGIIDLTSEFESYFNIVYPPSGNSMYVNISLASVESTSAVNSPYTSLNAQFVPV